MRKRTILAVIITFIIVICANKLYISTRPMTVDFDIIGKGDASIEVQLNKKNDDKFQKIKFAKKDADIEHQNHLSFVINHVVYPKKMRIVIKKCLLGEQIEIKNITLKNGKYKIDDVNLFSSSSDVKLSYKDGSIFLTPPSLLTANDIILTYNKKLHIRSSLKFDIKVFVIILILTFLLTYKLANYIADFKSVRNKSRIEIIFLALFFISLFIPMSYISKADISKNENRTLAKWSPLVFDNGTINYDFGKNYNDWFNDRFNLRPFLLDVHTKFSLAVNKRTDRGSIEKDGFVFYGTEYDGSWLKNINDDDYKGLVEFDKFFKENNLDFYVLIVPMRTYVYPHKNLLVKDDYDKQITKKLDEISKKYNIQIINPLEALREGAKSELMFYKTDFHWTFDGAYVGYRELMKEITKKHKGIPIVDKSEYTVWEDNMIIPLWERKLTYGHVPIYMHLSEPYVKKLHNTKYKYYVHKNSKNLKIVEQDILYHKNRHFYYPDGANQKVLLLGNSMSENLLEFLAYSFKDVFRLSNYGMKGIEEKDIFKIIKYYKNDILEYKPDIVIYCICYNVIPSLDDLVNME